MTDDEKLPVNDPRYGMISLHRVYCSQPTPLVGSNIKHNTFIELEIKSAEYNRSDLQYDKYFSREPLVKIALSSTQLGELFSSMNTEGTPCTLEFLTSKGEGRITNDIPYVDKIAVHKKEYHDRYAKGIHHSLECITKLQDGLSNKMGKKEMRDLLHDAESELRNFISNAAFALTQFDTHLEQQVSEAKNEIASIMEKYQFEARQMMIESNYNQTLEMRKLEDKDGRS